MSDLWTSVPSLVVVIGKGGVGKTLVSCALARAAAAAGRRVLLLELDARESLHRFLGCSPSGGAVISAGDRLWAQSVRPRAVVDTLIEHRVRPRWAARRLLASQIYEQFVAGAPGLREVAALGHAVESGGSYDLVILDSPASGHGVALLAAPRLLAAAIGSGPLAELAGEVDAKVADPAASRLWAVSTVEAMALRETLELDVALESAIGRGLDQLVLNRLLPDEAVELAGEAAWQRLWRDRARAQRGHLERLGSRWQRPVVRLPLTAAEGQAATAELSALLAAELSP